jgi:hypothetical protein
LAALHISILSDRALIINYFKNCADNYGKWTHHGSDAGCIQHNQRFSQIFLEKKYGVNTPSWIIQPFKFNKNWFFTKKIKFVKPFTVVFDLLEQNFLNGLFWFFFDKVRHSLSKFSTLVTSQKSSFLHFLMHRNVFLKKVSLQILLSNINHHQSFKFWKNLYF